LVTVVGPVRAPDADLRRHRDRRAPAAAGQPRPGGGRRGDRAALDRRRPVTGASFPALADRLLAEPPLLGATRLVCVDGPAGSGKTTFADRLTEALGGAAALVHMDDLY